MRDDSFLQRQLDEMLSGPFANVLIKNKLEIKFGRRALRRFGSIKMTRDEKVSLITINGHFRDSKIPEEVILATLAHELCHYAHGFSSPLPKLYKHPHRGGVIKKEMTARGLLKLFEFEKKWTKANWPEIVGGSKFARPHRRVKKITLKQLIKSFI